MDINSIKEILIRAKKDSRNTLDLLESRTVLKELNVPLNRAEVASSDDEAVLISKKIGYPVAMKIVSPDVLHKTEAGGVVLNIKDSGEARVAFQEILKNVKSVIPHARIKGVLIEEMLKGNELIVGTTKDVVFGNMIMFGIGGVLVELYRDVAFRLVPIKKIDAIEMLNEIKAKDILNGYRKSHPVDKEQLIGIMLNVSDCVSKLPEIESLEINPLLITKRGLVAIDARVIII